MTILDKLIVGLFSTNCYIYGSNRTKEILIIDPGASAKKIIKHIKNQNYNPIAVFLTHEHTDHTSKANEICKRFKIPLIASKYAKSRKLQVDRKIIEGEKIKVAEIELNILESPGHSSGGLILVDFDNKILFVGDSIFKGSIGRTDLGGNKNQLFNSIRTKIMENKEISDKFILYPGHGPQTTVGIEKHTNLFRKYFT